MAQLTFLGVGDAADPSGANTSVLYRGERTLLVDCGPAIASAAFRTLGDVEALDGLWITHQHADHCFGLPTLLLMLRLAHRKKALDIMGGPGIAAAMRALAELGFGGAFEPDKCFPINFLELSPERGLDWHGLGLATAQTIHNVPCFALRIDAGTARVCVSGDGRPSEATLELYRDATLVVHECQFADRKQKYHSRVDDLTDLFEKARVAQVALVHHSTHERASIAEKAQSLFGSRAFMPQTGQIVRIAASSSEG